MITFKSRRAASKIVAVIVAAIVVAIAAVGAFLVPPQVMNTSQSTTSQTAPKSSSTSSTTTPSLPSTSNTSSSSYTNSSSTNQNLSLPYDSATKTVSFTLVILNNVSSEVDYNGTNFGAMVMYVPAGSNLKMTLVNLETLPHNLVLVQNSTDMPSGPDVGANGKILFAVGSTIQNYLYQGFPKGAANGTYDSIAPGSYWLACGIKKHAGDGLWVTLVASSSVSAPYFTVGSPSLRPAGFS